MSITDATTDTDTSSDNDTINDDENNTSNERIDYGLQSTYGDRTGYKSIIVIIIIRLISSIESYWQIRSPYIRVIKMHAVTISSLTKATPSPMKETTSPMVTLHQFPVNSESLCLCVEF